MILLKNRDRNPSFKSGKYVEINDAGNYPMELSVDGVCEQETTSGKNRLPNNATSKTLNGVTFAKNSDGTVVVNGTSTASCFYNIISDNEVPITTTNLILSGCPFGGTSSSYRLRATYTDTSYSEDVGNSIKLKDGKVLQIVTIVITNGTTCNNLTFKPMISSDGGEYEPYTGGQPSPSPDYPQEIKTIENRLKITSCNKNLLALPNKTIISNGVTSTIKNNELIIKGTCTQNWFKISENLNLHLKAGTYTLSRTTKDAYRYNLGITLASGTNKIIYGSTEYNTTFTIDEDFIINTLVSDSNIVGTSFDFKDYVQLEQGSQATSFEEHLQSQIIANLGNEFVGKLDDTYKDTLNVVYKDDGHYHLILNKMIGKVVFDGSEEGWNKSSITEVDRFSIGGITNMSTKTRMLISNYFKYKFSTEEGTIFNNLSNSIIINYMAYGTTTLEQFKNWLSTHNTEVYYALATPYEVDLGIVDTLLSYDEVTNVFTDSDLLPQINAKYYKGFEFDKILRSGYNIDEQEYEIAKKQMANGKRKRILSSYVDCIIKINLGLLDNKTYQEYKEQLDDGEFHYWSYKYNQYKKANFILTKPPITTEYAYDDDIGINDMEITLEKSSDIE